MSCCHRHNCTKQKKEQPAEPLLEAVFNFEAVAALLDIANSGLDAGVRLQKTVMQHGPLRALAATIADLAIENQSLKNLLSPVGVDIKGDTARLSFGADAQYTLLVPIHNATERRVLRQQLLDAAAILAPAADATSPHQHLLPFDN
jgi:hypothetical protein